MTRKWDTKDHKQQLQDCGFNSCATNLMATRDASRKPFALDKQTKVTGLQDDLCRKLVYYMQKPFDRW